MLILALALAIGLELGQSLDYDRPGLGLGQTWRYARPGPRPGMRLRGQVCGYAKLLIYIVIVVRSVLLLINSKIKLNLYLM